MRKLRSRVRWLAVPILAYLVITLGLPLANGAGRGADFVKHAGFILLGCLFVIGIFVIGAVLVWIARKGDRS